MRMYRVELESRDRWFTTCFEAKNENEAKQVAGKLYYGYSVMNCVEVIL